MFDALIVGCGPVGGIGDHQARTAGERFIRLRVAAGVCASTLLNDKTGGGWRLFVSSAAEADAATLLRSLDLRLPDPLAQPRKEI